MSIPTSLSRRNGYSAARCYAIILLLALEVFVYVYVKHSTCNSVGVVELLYVVCPERATVFWKVLVIEISIPTYLLAKLSLGLPNDTFSDGV